MSKKKFVSFCLNASVLAVLAFLAFARTDELEVQTLRDMYIALNSPEQLRSWELDGGDPCEDLWVGVSCSGSSVIHIKLRGLNLTGTLGFQIGNLQHLKELDLSSNNIEGEIPYELPLNLMHLTLACNHFSHNIPDSLSSLKNLRSLNLSRNVLSGPLGGFLRGLRNLKEMDLSYNNLTGDLPSSFGALTSLKALFLQSNSLTGSVNLLADLPLKYLNIEDNHFSGVIPEKFQGISYLWFGGNWFSRGENYPPWNFPPIALPNETNICSSPSPLPAVPGPIEKNHSPHKPKKPKKLKRLSSLGKAAVIVVAPILFVAICYAIGIAVQKLKRHWQMLEIPEVTERNRIPTQISSPVREFPIAAREDNMPSSIMRSPPQLIASPLNLPPVPSRDLGLPRRSLTKKSKIPIPICAKLYTMAELESATNCFSQENLIGEGSLGSIYRAEFPDRQPFIVKRINMVIPEEQFLDAIGPASRLWHSNIIPLTGYSVELGHCLLVYEFVRNMSLHNALHNAALETLHWNPRLCVAVGVARALNYMHSSCVPPVAHCNLTAANIFLDEELRPRISDCGLENLRRLINSRIKLKAPETAFTAYGSLNALADDIQEEMTRNKKKDVLDFGVLLLELLTGRLPLDSSRPKAEESLVEWSKGRLHDITSLAEMVDPSIKNAIPPKTLSHLADIILLCLQVEEFRAPMDEVMDAVKCLVQKSGSLKEVEMCIDDRSFRSTSSHFIASPTRSYYSV